MTLQSTETIDGLWIYINGSIVDKKSMLMYNGI